MLKCFANLNGNEFIILTKAEVKNELIVSDSLFCNDEIIEYKNNKYINVLVYHKYAVLFRLKDYLANKQSVPLLIELRDYLELLSNANKKSLRDKGF